MVPAEFSAPSQASILQNRVYKSMHLFCDWGRRIKADFSFSVILLLGNIKNDSETRSGTELKELFPVNTVVL